MTSNSAAYQRQWRAEHPEQLAAQRWAIRTRGRALERLAKEYPARFAKLLVEVRQAEPDPRLNGRKAT